MRPATGVLDGGAPPDAAGAVELERHATPCTDILLDGEMSVLHEALGTRQPITLAVAPFDAGLHERGARIGKHRGHRLLQPAGRWHEIGVEYRDIGSVTERHAGSQRASLEAAAIDAPDMHDVHARAAKPRDGMNGDV